MGLDMVEVVMELEDRFHIDLSKTDFSAVVTVADLSALVWRNLPQASNVCPSARTFYELRRVLVEHDGLARRSIRPSMRLDRLRERGFRRWWKSLRRVDRRLPRLVKSPRMDRFMMIVALGCVVAWAVGLVTLLAVMAMPFGLMCACAVLFLLLKAFMLVNDVLNRHLPEGICTVGDLASAVAPMQVGYTSPGERLAMQVKVLDEVRGLVAEQFARRIDTVRPETTFKELGV